MHQFLKIECDECGYEDVLRLNVTAALNDNELDAMRKFMIEIHKKRDH